MDDIQTISALKVFGEYLQGKHTIPILLLLSNGIIRNEEIANILCISKQSVNQVLARLLKVHIISRNEFHEYKIRPTFSKMFDIMFIMFRNIKLTRTIHPFKERNPNTDYKYIDKPQ